MDTRGCSCLKTEKITYFIELKLYYSMKGTQRSGLNCNTGYTPFTCTDRAKTEIDRNETQNVLVPTYLAHNTIRAHYID